MSSFNRITSGTFPMALAMVLAVQAFGPGRALAQAPIHEYRFDGSGADSSGVAHGVVGAEVGFTILGVPAGLGQAAVFGTDSPYDSNDAIEVDNALFTGFGTGDFTIAAWVRRTDTSGRGDIIDANGNANDAEGEGPGFQLQIAFNDSIRLRIDDDVTNVKPDFAARIDDTAWHHLVVTVDRDDSQGFKYYVDGVFDSAFDPTAVSGNVTPHQDLRFGSINSAGSFAGELAMFQVFDVALSADQVAGLYCGVGEDCDGDGLSDVCELGEVAIRFDDQPVGALAPFSHLGYALSPVTNTPDLVNFGGPAPALGDADRFGTSATSIVATGGELFRFVSADYNNTGLTVRFDGYVDGVQTETQSAPSVGSGTLVSTFESPIHELRITIWTEFPADAWADNIVLKRADDCDNNGVPDACDSDCDNDGVPDACEPDADNDNVPDDCDVCAGGDDKLDTDADGIANACDTCAGGQGTADAGADGFIELDDMAGFVGCFGGPGVGTPGDGCDCFDTDNDGDVDMADLGRITVLFKPAQCEIDGVTYRPGDRDAYPNNCRICDPWQSETSWSPAPTSILCRTGSGDLCDSAEFCDGVSEVCPSDVVAPGDVVCRPSAGECDTAEFCPGTAGAACPADDVRASGATCRVAAGVCDVAETCDGVSAHCPPDGFAPNTTICKDNTGTCKEDKTCDGASAACPNGSTSKPVGSFCDTNNACPGAGVCGDQSGNINCVCPGLTRCWPTQGACDRDDFYDANGECLQDRVRGTSYVCDDNTGTCQKDIKCDGLNKACPSVAQNRVQGAACIQGRCPDEGVCNSGGSCICPGVDVCRQAAGVCDRQELYNANGGCPANQLYGPDVACRREIDLFGVSDGACNPPEYCDGQSVDCPPDVIANIGDVCRSSGECEAQYLCHGHCAVDPVGGGGPFAPRCTSDSECDPGETCIVPPQVSLVPLTCEKKGTTPANGTPCNNGTDACQNGECASLAVSEGGACDGDDFYVIGDLNGFHCDNDAPDDLFCCKGSRLARDGETGTCKKCCGNVSEENGGCPQNNERSIYCCSGECVDIDNDLEHCGSCGNSCQALVDTSPCKINPQCGATNNNVFTPGICFYDQPCDSDTEYCYDDCNVCFFFGNCDTCTEGAQCLEYEGIDIASSCAQCSSDGDCTLSGETCWSGCGGDGSVGVMFCLAPGFCAKDPTDCGS
ncbi:MAG: hypothetical protein J5J06_06520 [Phycisphaerae bacterium]|nr:hypothetical protein [Phycisphaerae bacterium]